jgi:type VI secretion system protein ImpF
MGDSPTGAHARPGAATGPWAQRRGDVERPVQASLLDRLTDEEPFVSTERLPSREASVAALRVAVRRDLEWLLNTRQDLLTLAPELAEARRSFLRYGLPDVSSLPREGGNTAARLARAVEQAVALFEPRLAQVRVTAAADPGVAWRPELRFTIEGLLRIDPAPERVVFDTVVEMARGEYQVRGADEAEG